MRKKQNGFSLLELLVVMAIIMVIAAMAIPNVMTAINNIRLRGSAGDVAGLLQLCRERAVRNNRYYTVKPATVTGAQAAYVDLNYNDVFDNAAPTPEPMIQFAANVTVANAGAPNTANLWANAFQPGFTPQNANILPSFNARGLPCVGAANPPAANAVCNIRDAGNQTVGFAYYLSQTRPFGAVGWAAVTVTPSGRIRVWVYDGTAWE